MSVYLLPSAPPPARNLDELASRYARCYQCPLAYSRRRILPGSGRRFGGIALVSDRIAGLDERERRLLSGPPGELQARVLALPKVSIPVNEVYLTSTVLCRSPLDRMPKAREAAACRDRLRQELALVEPLVIVALGLRAGALLADCPQESEPHRWLVWRNAGREIPAYITVHPREAIWGASGELKRKKRILYDDWQAISARFHALTLAERDDPTNRGEP